MPAGRARYAYTYLLRRLGFGYHKDERPASQWTADSLAWIDSYCFYRPYRELMAVLGAEHSVRHRELEYCRFRARGVVSRALNVDRLRPVAERLFRRLGFMALELRPLPASPASRED
jgi:hypothetical protein